jgi:hypothetical protein
MGLIRVCVLAALNDRRQAGRLPPFAVVGGGFGLAGAPRSIGGVSSPRPTFFLSWCKERSQSTLEYGTRFEPMSPVGAVLPRVLARRRPFSLARGVADGGSGYEVM